MADYAAQAARLAKADLVTDMVREFTELQGRMGGIYAREEGLPEEVWKAIYFHYLPLGVDADAPPTRAQLGKAAVTWAAVSLADKLDTIVGLYDHEEADRLQGSIRCAGRHQGVVKGAGGYRGADRRDHQAGSGSDDCRRALIEVLGQPATLDAGADAGLGIPDGSAPVT